VAPKRLLQLSCITKVPISLHSVIAGVASGRQFSLNSRTLEGEVKDFDVPFSFLFGGNELDCKFIMVIFFSYKRSIEGIHPIFDLMSLIVEDSSLPDDGASGSSVLVVLVSTCFSIGRESTRGF